jgi:drug/metabolite transporter (DMT)-like permease
MYMGIVFACIALFSWGFGDFLIQRSARKFGDVIALFFITAFAGIFLFPFVYRDFFSLLADKDPSILILLFFATAVIFIASILDFEALRIGKISVIEPIYAFEIIVTASLSAFIIQEKLGFVQIALIAILTTGILLVSLKTTAHLKKIRWERGVMYAILATLAMGGVNFLFGVGSRESHPLLVNWFTSFGMAVVLFVYILRTGQFSALKKNFLKHKRLVLGVSLLDNLAWIAFAYSTLSIPIAIATGISESYIALAALLGITFNKEILKPHQYVGLAVTLLAAVSLAFTISE